MAKVLAIDDSAAMLAHVAHVLEQAGHQVLTAGNCKEGLALLAADGVDVILTDIYMPDQDGLDVIRQAMKLRPRTPIIAMSSMTGKWSMMKIAKLMGACQGLPKPFSDAALIAAVAQACGQVKQ